MPSVDVEQSYILGASLALLPRHAPLVVLGDLLALALRVDLAVTFVETGFALELQIENLRLLLAIPELELLPLLQRQRQHLPRLRNERFRIWDKDGTRPLRGGWWWGGITRLDIPATGDIPV